MLFIRVVMVTFAAILLLSGRYDAEQGSTVHCRHTMRAEHVAIGRLLIGDIVDEGLHLPIACD